MFVLNEIQASIVILAFMFLVALAGWFAGASAYISSQLRKHFKHRINLPRWRTVGLLTLVAYVALFIPLFQRQDPWDTATALGFIGMHFIPFLLIGAHCGWLFHSTRHLRREKLRTAWDSIRQLRIKGRQASGTSALIK